MIGQTLGHYRIESKLGEGGMGVVYRAVDTRLDRPVALKVLRADAMANPERKKRFVQEAKAASALNHPNIITIYDIGTADGTDFIAMEFVRGQTLDRLIGRKGLRLQEALSYAAQMADALAAAHAAGITHRDLKPGNVMVTESGLVKLLDFGLAKVAGRGGAGEQDLTQAPTMDKPQTVEGAILGTVSYMSPEQAEGKPVDARSDIFSFGAVFYEMVTGQRAFHGGSTMSTLTAILRDEPQPAGQLAEGVPRELERVIARCLRKDLQRRYQAMADLKVELEDLKEESQSGQWTAAVSAAPVAARKTRAAWVWGVALAGALVLAGATLWILRPATKAPQAPLKVVPLTSYPGVEMQPAFSPDGNQVAFCWRGEKQDNWDIYVKLIDGSPPLRLTTDPAPDFLPAWSPDGRRIAFLRQREQGGDILVIPALGGPERRLAQVVGLGSVPNHLSWSPDGKFLAFADRNSPEEPVAIFLLSVETGEKRKLTSPPSHLAGDYYPVFSPGSLTLAFIRGDGFGKNFVHLLALDTTGAPREEPRQVTFGEWPFRGMDWMPDGKSVVVSAATGGHDGLWRVRDSGGPAEFLGFGESAQGPSVARQGNRLVYEQRLADLNIWRIGGMASGASAASPVEFIASTKRDLSPQFSPDGKKIAFVSNRTGYHQVWVSDEDGSNAHAVTSFSTPSLGSPRWSPDGRVISFDVNQEGNWDVWSVAADGGAPRRLTTDRASDVRSSWSQDGRWIYFGSNRGGRWQIWKMPPTGEPAVQVTRNGGEEPFESPDGRYLYYARDRSPGIWRVPVEGGEEMKALEKAEESQWGISREGIHFFEFAPGAGPALKFFRFSDGKILPIASLGPNTRLYRVGGPAFAVSPDGRWVLYSQVDRIEGDILLVENFQ